MIRLLATRMAVLAVPASLAARQDTLLQLVGLAWHSLIHRIY